MKKNIISLFGRLIHSKKIKEYESKIKTIYVEDWSNEKWEDYALDCVKTITELKELVNINTGNKRMEYLIGLQAYYNVGGPDYITIKDLANIISKVVKYNGKIIFNTNFPDGVKERKLDSTQFINLGWKPKIKLKNGLVNYYKNFVKKYY